MADYCRSADVSEKCILDEDMVMKGFLKKVWNSPAGFVTSIAVGTFLVFIPACLAAGRYVLAPFYAWILLG